MEIYKKRQMEQKIDKEQIVHYICTDKERENKKRCNTPIDFITSN